MADKREILGLWWLPSQSQEGWVGTLTLQTDKSPHLRITVPKGYINVNQILPSVIHGSDQHGKSMTLLYPSWPRPHGGMALSQVDYSAGFAVLANALSDYGGSWQQ